uniref:Prolyl endopeptidase n=3 Tax=Hemiselmis andersenii TaxID=464988 RepID=A0A7S1DPL6_HEMAN
MDRYYFYKNDGLQNQYVLMTQKTLEDAPEVFFDPNALSSDGTKSLGPSSFSESGKYWAYGITASGSDWNTLYVKDIETGKTLEDKVEWVKFSGISWLHDDSGFFYSRYPEPKTLAAKGEKDEVEGDDVKRGSETDSNLNMAVYFHKIGDPSSMDTLIYSDPTVPKWMFRAQVSDDGEYMLVTVSESTAPVNRLYTAKVSDVMAHVAAGGGGSVGVTKLIDNFDAGYDYVTNEKELFYFKTNKDAPKYKVITIDLGDPGTTKDLIPHKEDVLSDALCVANNLLVCVYMKDAHETLWIYSLTDGSVKQQVALPDIGSVANCTGRKEDSEFFYSFGGFVYPGSKFRFDTSSMESMLLREDKVVDHDPSYFETKQVFYASKDGTKIPMFIVCKKGKVFTGDTCTLLYGYGGFSISITPSFSPFRTVFIKHFDGCLAVANIRGGGEYGEEWHEAGIKLTKQNGFTDFQCAAEYLVDNKYTNPSKLTINGGSNGGLLVGACVNQRPDLFACAIPQVGVMDMLRFHKFTIGYAWCSDYGCADEDEANFKNLYGFSPLHNIKVPEGDVQYPAVLVTTADHDDRVVPLHSMKYAAQLQHAFKGVAKQKRPLLIRVDVKAGHGAGKPTSKIIEEIADIYAFIGANTGTECKREVV